MSVTKIVFTHTLSDAGDETRIDSVVLSDKIGAYGVREKASQTVLVANDTAMEDGGTGIWYFDLETVGAYDKELEYEFALEILQDDGDKFWVSGTVPKVVTSAAPSTMTTYAMDYEELADKVALLVGDPSHSRYTEDEIIEELGSVMADFAVETGFITESITVLGVADQAEYDIAGIVEGVGLRPYAFPHRIVYNGLDQPALQPATQQTIDLLRFVDYTGTPYRWLTDTVDWGTIKTWGIPAEAGVALPSTTNNLSVWYYALPFKRVLGADYPDPAFPSTIIETFIYGAARNLLLCEADRALIDKAIEYHAKYEYHKSNAMSDRGSGIAGYEGVNPL